MAAIAAACALAPVLPPSHAAAWGVDRSLEWGVDANDNYGLPVGQTNRVAAMSLTGGVGAGRRTENSQTRLEARLTGQALRGDLHQGEVDGNLSFSHAVTAPRDEFAWNAAKTQDTTLQTPLSSADLLLGRIRRRTENVTATWTRRLSERWSTTGSLALDRAIYSQRVSGAVDYRNLTLAANSQFRLDERSTLSARLSHADYRTLEGGSRALTDSLGAGLSRNFSATASAGVNIGRYRTRSEALQPVRVCPVQADLCQAGIVSYIVIDQLGSTLRWGLQYSGSGSLQLDERSRVSFSASRQQDPSGAGVLVRSDTLAATLAHAFTPTLDGTFAYTRSRSTYEGLVTAPQPRLQTLAAQLSKALAPDTTLRAEFRHTRSDEPVSGRHAHANSLSLVLRVEWPSRAAER